MSILSRRSQVHTAGFQLVIDSRYGQIRLQHLKVGHRRRDMRRCHGRSRHPDQHASGRRADDGGTRRRKIKETSVIGIRSGVSIHAKGADGQRFVVVGRIAEGHIHTVISRSAADGDAVFVRLVDEGIQISHGHGVGRHETETHIDHVGVMT